jgi:ribosomal protein S18 acetylase RimI-like enzyme
MEGGVHGLHLGPLETPADVETCVALMRASDPWQRLRITEDACRRTITHPQREAYAAWRGQALVGFVVLAFQGPLSGYVQLLGVAPAARGQGVGRALMALAERIAFARGPNLFLCVSAFNEGARRFYARLGFQEVGCLTDFLVHGEDEWLLRKTRGPLMATPAAAASPASPAGHR